MPRPALRELRPLGTQTGNKWASHVNEGFVQLVRSAVTLDPPVPCGLREVSEGPMRPLGWAAGKGSSVGVRRCALRLGPAGSCGETGLGLRRSWRQGGLPSHGCGWTQWTRQQGPESMPLCPKGSGGGGTARHRALSSAPQQPAPCPPGLARPRGPGSLRCAGGTIWGMQGTDRG